MRRRRLDGHAGQDFRIRHVDVDLDATGEGEARGASRPRHPRPSEPQAALGVPLADEVLVANQALSHRGPRAQHRLPRP